MKYVRGWKNLKKSGMKMMRESLKRYYEVKNKMRKFADKVNIPMAHLDLLLWYKETGEIFK
jgi:thermostable 8-oxoguanine DNA glycosylase